LLRPLGDGIMATTQITLSRIGARSSGITTTGMARS
jgi:hypothetical protein